jgi:hypothetical protein
VGGGGVGSTVPPPPPPPRRINGPRWLHTWVRPPTGRPKHNQGYSPAFGR